MTQYRAVEAAKAMADASLTTLRAVALAKAGQPAAAPYRAVLAARALAAHDLPTRRAVAVRRARGG